MNLRSAYERITFTRDQMMDIFQGIAYALHYLHELKISIIHRDLSAPNVLLNSLPQAQGRYVARVTDFGSANLEKLSKTSCEGAAIYSAPEMFFPRRSKGFSSCQADCEGWFFQLWHIIVWSDRP